MPSINFSRALCETSDLIKWTVCKENIDSMQENINGMHVHILLLNVFWTLVLKNVTSISCLSVDLSFNDEVGLNDTSSSLTLSSRLQLNFLSDVSTKPRTAATDCCCWLLRSRRKLYTVCRASASPFLKHFSHHAFSFYSLQFFSWWSCISWWKWAELCSGGLRQRFASSMQWEDRNWIETERAQTTASRQTEIGIPQKMMNARAKKPG